MIWRSETFAQNRIRKLTVPVWGPKLPMRTIRTLSRPFSPLRRILSRTTSQIKRVSVIPCLQIRLLVGRSSKLNSILIQRVPEECLFSLPCPVPEHGYVLQTCPTLSYRSNDEAHTKLSRECFQRISFTSHMSLRNFLIRAFWIPDGRTDLLHIL